MDNIINDLGYVRGRIFYDELNDDGETRLVIRNRVKVAASRMGKLSREGVAWPFEAIANYDY